MVVPGNSKKTGECISAPSDDAFFLIQSQAKTIALYPVVRSRPNQRLNKTVSSLVSLGGLGFIGRKDDKENVPAETSRRRTLGD